MEYSMEKIIALAKSRGFVYPGSEIYGGLANTWDYGNLGVELKNNVKAAWWQKFIKESPYNVGVDCAILMNPQTWIASGHLGSFSDPLMDCKECHERFRADKVIEEYMAANDIELEGSVDAWSKEEMKKYNVEEPSNLLSSAIDKENILFFWSPSSGKMDQVKKIMKEHYQKDVYFEEVEVVTSDMNLYRLRTGEGR